jgi:transposase
MYLRTTKRKNKDGSVVEYYQLAHNKRHPETGKPVAHIIHNFGRTDELDRDHLVRLCRSIARVCGLKVTDPIAGDSNTTGLPGFPKDLKLIGTQTLGTPLVIEALWERLGIGQIFRDICKSKKFKVPYERAIFAMVANRLTDPDSKLGLWERWLSRVYIPSCRLLKLEQLYEAMDLFYDHMSEVEEQIFFQTANLLNLEVDLVFYDTTTASFSIDYEDSFRAFGHSKEGTWSPQIVVALAVTREGLPVRSWIFPGNTSDAATIKKIRDDLRGWKLGRALFVADSGMNSIENKKELSKACGKYLLASRMASVSEIRDTVLSKRGRYTVISDNLHAKEVIIGDGERRRRYILCSNPSEARRQKKHREEVVAFLEMELDKHKSRKATARWAIELLASKRYKRYLTITKSDNIRIDRNKIKESEKYDGKWVIETNDDTITLEDAACGYKGLMVIERCFRSMKRTQIKMCPMYHWVPRRIEAHVKLCVLSLLIERVAEIECNDTWSRIQHNLEGLQVSEFRTNSHKFFRHNEITSNVRNLLNKLKIPTPNIVAELEKL